MGNVRMRAEQINYGATNVKAALDDLDPMDLIALSKRMNKIEAWKATVKAEEKTGSTVEYTNALALAALSLSADIVPIQDLHGQSAPYVGGSGKNKLPLTLANIKTINTTGTWNGNVYTVNSGTFEVLVDSANNVTGIKVNGTFTANSEIKLTVATYANNDYKGKIINGCANGSADTYNILTTYSSNGTSWADEMPQYGNTDKTISSDYDYIRFSVFVKANTEVSNIVIYPMIRNSGESATFAPYSNICPISGRTAAVITRSDGDEISEDFTIQFGQTVYGGTLNFNTGVLTVTRASDDLGDYTWTYDSGTNSMKCTMSGCKRPSADTEVFNAIMSICPVIAAADRTTTSGIRAYMFAFGDIELYVRDSGYTDATAFKTAMTGQTICYELATPIELTLTPVAVEMLKGYNQISSDGGGDITVEAYTGAAWGGDEA